jgi:hypothetical protein
MRKKQKLLLASMAYSWNNTKLVLESDCALLVEKIVNNGGDPSLLSDIIHDIRQAMIDREAAQV